MQRQRIRFGTVVVLWGDHFDLGNRAEGRVQGHNARGLKTIVVGKQNFHGAQG
jgi:hypothetical protein